MSDNGIETPVFEVKMGSANGTVDEPSPIVSENGYFWVGIKIPKSLIFGGLGYVAGGVLGIYGGFFGVFLVGILALYVYMLF